MSHIQGTPVPSHCTDLAILNTIQYLDHTNTTKLTILSRLLLLFLSIDILSIGAAICELILKPTKLNQKGTYLYISVSKKLKVFRTRLVAKCMLNASFRKFFLIAHLDPNTNQISSGPSTIGENNYE